MAARNSVVSPLLNRIQKQESLTLTNLAYHVPRVREGKEAHVAINEENNLTASEIAQLKKKVQQGEDSKETLVLMALPLVSTIARSEYNRRSAWSSRVTLDDMVQEGVGGFLRGIDAYKVGGGQTSPTNYLGQWILSDIRRHVESLDHDFSIPHETIERHRKIRAIRSRLFNELERYPTDQEILDHANNRANQPVNKMGKVNKEGYTGKKLTQKNIDEERSYSASTGRLESLTVTDDENSEYEKKANPLSGDEVPTSNTAIEENSARKALSRFFEKVFVSMGLGGMQEDIVRQKFGLPPHAAEIPLSGIAKNTNISKYKVNQVITAFTKEMSSAGSVFHAEVSKMDYDEVDSLGLGWVISIIGDYDQSRPNQVDRLLTQDMKPPPRNPKKKFGDEDRGIRYNHRVYATCEAGHVTTKGLIASANAKRAISVCSTCGAPAEFTKMESYD